MRFSRPRKIGRALISTHHWKARIVLWIAAGLVGCIAVGFAELANLAIATLRRLVAFWPYAPWILAPIGICGSAWATRRFFRGAEGSGIPQAIFTLFPGALQPEARRAADTPHGAAEAERHSTDAEHRGTPAERLLALHVVAGRIGLAAVGLLCGGSIGREGPTVHVGAAITHAFGRWMPHGRVDAQRRALILAGGAAGVAAAFNTPLAGIVFAIEELSKSFEERASGVTLTAVILAGVVTIALVGDYTYFGQPVVAASADNVTLVTLLVALVSGIAGAIFSRVTLAGVAGLPGALGRLQKERPVAFAALCGLAVALIGFAARGLTYGTGYDEARSILVGNAHLPWFYAPARALASLVVYLSGIPAGLLSPSLSVGAGLGQFLADASHQSSAVPFAILGMCGYLAGVTQAPLTSLVIVMEMTTKHEMVLPLMVTAAVATAVAKLISPPLYHALAERYAAAAESGAAKAPEPAPATPSA